MKYETLEPPAIAEALASLDGWEPEPDGKTITRTFRFRNFVEAFAFMTECAITAEKLNHHPDWSNSYREVTVRLTTHATKSLTDMDIRLARAMDTAFCRRN